MLFAHRGFELEITQNEGLRGEAPRGPKESAVLSEA